MQKLSWLARILIALGGLAMIFSFYVPVWSISLDAPQYPEGLELKIWVNKLSGNLDQINGLNHYIGMKPILESNFKEFAVMPYLVIAMIAISLLTAIFNRRFLLWIYVVYMIICGIWGSYDFWKWEYDYGHNLNDHAAIKVPGMAYQPPLFGYKQLLNFLAGSFPDTGGYLIIVPGFIAVTILSWYVIGDWRKKRVARNL